MNLNDLIDYGVDRSECFTFALNLNAFLCLDCLMQTFVEASAVHQTACKFVNNDNLAVLNNVVNVELHYAVSLDSLVNVVLEREVFGICKVVYAEEFLGFLNAYLGESGGFLLFVNNIVDAVLGVVFFHVVLCVDLGEALKLKSFCKSVGFFVEVG